jgi:hypothetical protein
MPSGVYTTLVALRQAEGPESITGWAGICTTLPGEIEQY